MTGNAGPSGTDPWRDLPPSVPDARDPGDPDHPFGTDPAPAETPAVPLPRMRPGPSGRHPAARRLRPTQPALPPMPAMDATTKLTLGAGFALAILGLLGVAIGTWNFTWSGIILILAGLVGAAGGWIGVTNAGKTLMIAARDIVLIGGTHRRGPRDPVRPAAHHRPRPPVAATAADWA